MKDNKREAIEEYINRCVHPEWAKRVFQKFNEEKSNLDTYKEDISFCMDKRIFNPEVMEAIHAKLQFLTHIEDGLISLDAFLAGDGFFYLVFPDGEYEELFLDSEDNYVDSREEADQVIALYGNELYAEMRLSETGELCIPLGQEKTGTKIVGKTVEDRDFKKYNVFDNIKWALLNSERDKYMDDSAWYSGPGLEMSIFDSIANELAYHNDPGIMIIDGILEYDDEQRAVIIRE